MRKFADHMSVVITSLNSGSNGNCYYIGNHNEAIMVDAGISCRETENRMHRLGLSMEKVKAIFISHEHTDHIVGLQVIAKKYQLPVYITDSTLRYSKIYLDTRLVNSFSLDTPVKIGDLTVTAFPKAHDASDPHSFVVSSETVKVGVITDIGIACKNVIENFRDCHAAFLESNYDEEMLMNGKYPYYLKNRIRGGKGHLSNTQAFELYSRYSAPYMSHLLLSHLSKENNCPKLVEELFTSQQRNTQIVVASRYCETPVFEIIATAAPVIYSRKTIQPKHQTQLSLF